MANEISVTTTLSVSKSGTTAAGSQTKLITLTGTGIFSNTQSIGASDEIVYFHPDLVTEGVGFIYIKNLDATKTVTLKKRDTGVNYPFALLLAGESMVLRTDEASGTDPDLYAVASSASADIQVVASGT